MATAAFSKFNDFSEQAARGVHDWDAHTFKVMLTNVAPTVANTVKADLTEIAAGNGYVAGGGATTIGVSEAGGVTTLTATQVQTVAAGGTIGPFQYAVLYNDTAVSKNLVGFWNYGTALTLADGESFTWKASNASPGTVLSYTI